MKWHMVVVRRVLAGVATLASMLAALLLAGCLALEVRVVPIAPVEPADRLAVAVNSAS